MDASGFERSHASRHYTKRTKLHIQELKTTLLVDTEENAILDVHIAASRKHDTQIGPQLGGILTGSLNVSGWHPLGWWPPVWGIIVTTIIYIVVSLQTESPGKADRFPKYIEKQIDEQNF